MQTKENLKGENMNTNNKQTNTNNNLKGDNMQTKEDINVDIKKQLKEELKEVTSYEDTLEVFNNLISQLQQKLSTADPIDVANITSDLTYVLNQQTNFIQLETTKKALEDITLEELKQLLTTKEYKKLKVNKKTVEDLINIKQQQHKKEILKDFEVVEILSDNINGKYVEDSGYILKKENKIILVSFDFLNVVFDTKELTIKVFDNNNLAYSRFNGHHISKFYDFIKNYFENLGYTGFEDTKNITYSKGYNYLKRMQINKEDKTISFNGFDNINFFENPEI